jgi:outer membrane lipoprotein-sorting protein
MKFRSTIIFILLIFISAPAFSLPKVIDIMKEMDLRYEQVGDISAKVNITQNKASQGVKIFEILYFRKDKTDEFLMVFTGPEAEKGNGYLRVGDNFWMYRQNTRTFQHISRDESISGTDSKAGDFERKKLVDLYKPLTNAAGVEDIHEEMLGKKAVYKFTLVAKVNDVTYPKVIYWIEKDTLIMLKTQSYSLSDTLMNTSYFPKWTQLEGKYLWLQGIFIDEFEKGNKSIVDLSGISLAPLDSKIFTKPYLENLSK